MILECPSCHARFKVADHLIPPAGRTVRCSKCAHAWHVELRAEAVAAKEAEPYRPEPTEAIMPSGEAMAMSEPPPQVESRLRERIRPTRRADDPKPLSSKPFKIAVPLIAACWAVLAFITYSPSWSRGALSGLYESMGNTPTDGLAFADVAMTREQDGAKTRFILTGSVRNNANAVRVVPTVRVMLKDKAGKTLWGREYAVNTEVKAGEIYPFRITNVETTFAKNIDKIIVDMGNSMQLLVR